MIKLVIFDLDGTLLDTIEDLAASTNAVLKERGYPVHEVERYKSFVGNGALKLVERALEGHGVLEEEIIKIKEEFVEYYDAHLLEHVKPYEGVVELLKSLKEQGIELAIATNKPHVQAVKLIEYVFEEITFIDVVGNQAHLPHKPDPFVVRGIIDKVNVSLEEVLYIGDSDVDMQTAVNAQVRGIGVSWGFRSEDELYANGAYSVIEHPSQLIKYIKH